nr:MAPEG family protein [uncultured Rhodopila sp.]
MTYPLVTSGYAAVLALIFLALSARVLAGRFAFNIYYGDGGDERLIRRMRAHANFAEFVPLILILSALLEARATSRFTIHALLLPLVIARALHPFGMEARVGSWQQLPFRGLPTAVTWIVMTAAAVLLLVDLV